MDWWLSNAELQVEVFFVSLAGWISSWGLINQTELLIKQFGFLSQFSFNFYTFGKLLILEVTTWDLEPQKA